MTPVAAGGSTATGGVGPLGGSIAMGGSTATGGVGLSGGSVAMGGVGPLGGSIAMGGSTTTGGAGSVKKPTLLGFADFGDGKVTPSSVHHGATWGSGATTGGVISVVDGVYRADYPVPSGGVYTYLNFNVAPLKLFELYIQLKARLIEPHSVKFVKVHGIEVGPNYSNTTYGLTANGVMAQVSFGDGTDEANDTANVINFTGEYPEWVGRSHPATANVSTPQNSPFVGFADEAWHMIRIHHKFNSGTSAANQVADGEYYVEIDGKIYVDAKGLFNRHYASAAIEYVAFGDWAQDNDYGFALLFDDIKISIEGFAE